MYTSVVLCRVFLMGSEMGLLSSSFETFVVEVKVTTSDIEVTEELQLIGLSLKVSPIDKWYMFVFS